MSNSFSLEQLTEGIRARHLGTQNRRLVEKWSRTGLLRGLNGVNRENMACLLENQASQVLREASVLGSDAMGDAGKVRGFSNVAFPIVRRVFGGLIANDLISVQPMSLPSGLLFYLDYTYGTAQGGVAEAEESLYNGPAGKGVQSGSLGSGGQFDLAGSSYSRKHQNATRTQGTEAHEFPVSDTLDAATVLVPRQGLADDGASLATTGAGGRLLMFDPELTKRIDEDGEFWTDIYVPLPASIVNLDTSAIKALSLVGTVSTSTAENIPSGMQAGSARNLRRLNELGVLDTVAETFTPNAFAARASTAAAAPQTGELVVKMIVKQDTEDTKWLETTTDNSQDLNLSHVVSSALNVDDAQGDTLVIPSMEGDGEDGRNSIPEIDIKIEALAVTAQSRKLKAKWSPELAQDLNAYHSLDAEVELTQILSEQIALEIDREILNDLLLQGNGANLYWSRSPGKFVNKETGAEVSSTSSLTPGPAFTGTVREWYETLTETVIDAANTIHRKTLRGSANFIVVGPDVATILESSVMYRPSYSLDGEGQVGSPMTIGADKVGTLSNRFTVYKDPYFPRNKILVGYKGGSYLETGYVYAPYVPLIVTPTIFQPEDFTPRKGVMTRYGKKMVRSDFYGTVTVLDMNVI
jgi:hypothetical protein